jgi:hypothetical protein
MNIIILHVPTIFNKPVISKELKPIIKQLSKIGKVHNYFFKFSYHKNKFNLEDIEFENASLDIYNTFKHLEKYLIIAINHACPYGLYFTNKYSKKCLGIICYPYRFYCKESYERRLWKLRDNNGWSSWIKKYDINDYLLNINNTKLQELLNKAGEEEVNIVYLIMDFYLQKNYILIPDKFKIRTILFTRLDLDVKSIIKFNYNRKDVAEMKKIFSENDALQNSMVWNFDRVKYDAYLKEKNDNRLKIKYIISSWENFEDVIDEVKLFIC